MDTIDKELLLRDVGRYGYHLVQPQSASAEDVLHRMLLSDDGRVLEGVPVVLSHVLHSVDQELDLQALEHSLPAGLQKRFRILSAVTYAFLFFVPESEFARKALLQYLRKREPALIDDVKEKLRSQAQLNVGASMTLDGERLEKTFKNYVVEQFMERQTSMTKKLERERESVFHESVSELFTDKQRELIFKMLNHEKLTKTEREYYSRVVKRRLKALRNPDLQSMAATLLV